MGMSCSRLGNYPRGYVTHSIGTLSELFLLVVSAFAPAEHGLARGSQLLRQARRGFTPKSSAAHRARDAQFVRSYDRSFVYGNGVGPRSNGKHYRRGVSVNPSDLYALDKFNVPFLEVLTDLWFLSVYGYSGQGKSICIQFFVSIRFYRGVSLDRVLTFTGGVVLLGWTQFLSFKRFILSFVY